MGYNYNAAARRGELIADGYGWSHVNRSLPPAPTAVKQMAVLSRFWVQDGPAITTAYLTETLTTNMAFLFGLSFTGAIPTGNGVEFSEPVGADLFGWSQVSSNGSSRSYAGMSRRSPSDSVRSQFLLPAHYNTLNLQVGDGKGSHLAGLSTYPAPASYLSDVPPNVIPVCIPYGATFGQTATHVIRIWADETGYGVNAEMWWCLNGMDWLTFNVATDLDPSNLKAALPPATDDSGNELLLQELNFATSSDDGKWRRGDGLLYLPTHYQFLNPFPAHSVYLMNPKIQYANG